MSVAIINPKFYAWGRDGKPLAFGKLYTYQARTNAPKDTYRSEDQVVENSNPVILNGEGYADVYLKGSYKMVLKDSDENEIWSADPVSSSNPSEWVLCLTATYLSSTSFKVAGNFTAEYDPERRVRINNNTSEYSYGTIKTSVYASGETTLTIDVPAITTGIIETCISIVGQESINTSGFLINDSSQTHEFKTLLEMTDSLITFPLDTGKVVTVGESRWNVVSTSSITPNLVDQRQSAGVPAQSFVYDNYGVLDFKHVGGGVGNTTQDNLIGQRTPAYLTLKVPQAMYTFTDEIVGQNNQTWLLENPVFIHTDNTKRVMFFQSKADFSILGRAIFRGLRADTTDSVITGEIGLNILNCRGYKINMPTFELFKGDGYLNDGAASISPYFAGKGQIDNITVKENITGFRLGEGAGAEYNTHTNVDAIGNNTGFSITSGNNTFVGGNSTKNSIGVDLIAGGNDTHGIISAMNINHNTARNVRATDIVAGQTFADCHIYADNVTSDNGAIELVNSIGIDFNGGTLFSRVITDESAQPDGYNFFRNMFMPEGPFRARNELNLPPKNTIFSGMTGAGTLNDLDGNRSVNDPSHCYVAVQRNANSLQAITSATATTLLFNTTPQSGDRRGIHVNATGVTTIPLTLGGWYNIKASIVFSSTTIDETLSNISIKKNGVTDQVSYPNIKASDNSIEIDIDYNTYLDGNDTIELTANITGTGINHGYAWPSTLQINKLG